VRPDDSEGVIHARLKIYKQNTLPVAEYYRRKKQLREIDGNRSADSVGTEIARVIGRLAI
jgi:adenylate kinase family enzyme